MITAPWKLAAGLLVAVVVALVLALVSTASARNEARRARDAAQAEVVTLAADLATARGSLVTLQVGVDTQNAATRRAAEQAAKQQAAGAAALRAVELENRELLARVGVLRGIQAREAPLTCQEGWDAFSDALLGR